MGRNRELVKNTIIITIGKIATQFMSFFLMPLYTSVLSVEEYGLVDLIITYSSLLLPFVFFQVDQAFFRFLIDVRDDDQGKKNIISTVYGFALIQIIITLFVFLIINPLVPIEYKWFLLFNVLTSILSNISLQLCRGLGDNLLYSLGSFTSAFSQIVGNILFLMVFNWGVLGMLTATISSHIITFLLILIKKKVYKYWSISFFKLSELKKVLSYSLPLVPNAISWWVLNASDRAIVSTFLGVGANGILSIGHKFSSIFITIYNIFNTSWTESASLHMNDPDRNEFFSNIINQSLKIFMCIGLGIIAFMPFVFPILVNDAFGDSYNLIPIFILASMFNVVVGLYSVIYVALKKSKEIAKTSIYSGVINIISHIVLIDFIGIYASAVSTVISFAVIAFYRSFDVKKYVDIEINYSLYFIIALTYIFEVIVYYSNNVLLKVLNLILVCILSYVLNKQIISVIIKGIFKKIKK